MGKQWHKHWGEMIVEREVGRLKHWKRQVVWRICMLPALF